MLPTTCVELTQREFRVLAERLGVSKTDTVIEGRPFWHRPADYPLDTSSAVIGIIGDTLLYWDRDKIQISAPVSNEILALAYEVKRFCAKELVPWSDKALQDFVDWLIAQADELDDIEVLAVSCYNELYQLIQSTVPQGGQDIVDGKPLEEAFRLVVDKAEAFLEDCNVITRREREFAAANARGLDMGTDWFSGWPLIAAACSRGRRRRKCVYSR